jgi:uncharacterized protein (TIGR02246 family)
MLALYDPQATFVAQPGQVVTGTTAIGEALHGFAALRPTLTSDIQQVLQAGEIALVINRWSLQGTQPDRQGVTLAGTSADVLRRRPDGEWRLVIDNPWAG